MSFSQEQLNNLIDEVGKEFQKELAKAEEGFKLAKSEDFPPKKEESKGKDEAKGSESKGEDKKEESKPEDKGSEQQPPAKEEGKEGDKPAAPPAAEGEKKPGEEQAPPAAAAPAEGQDHGYDDEDMQHMHSMYSSMSKPELKAHHDCIRKCMDSMGLAKCEDATAKSEKDVEVVVDNTQEISLLKSELEATKAESKKTLEAMESFLKKFVEKTAPAGKAITSLDIIAKHESKESEVKLSKSEIDAKLLEVSKSAATKPADRQAINSYYFTKNLETVRHLL